MSDPTSLPDDELVSAYLDGAATAEERALVEQRPDLLARVEQFRQVAARVANPPPTDDATREAAIHAALQAATNAATEAATVDPAPAVGPQVGGDGVTDLATARRARTEGRRSRRLVVLSAAAVVVLVVAVGAAVLRSRTTTSQVATAALTASPTTFSPVGQAIAGDESAPRAAANQSPTTTTPSAPNAPPADQASGAGSSPDVLRAGPSAFVGDAGSFADVSELAVSLGSAPTRPAASAAAGGVGTPVGDASAEQAASLALSTCAPQLGTDPTAGATSYGQATVDGQPVFFVVYGADPARSNPAGGRTLVVFRASCAVVGRQALPG